jgi:hypothetical protein
MADTGRVMTASTPQAIGTKLPFLFTYRDTLFGNGFIVEVQATNGRALCVYETDGCWMHGINPGGMSAVGEDPTTAHAAFRRTFSNILVDLAIESQSFEALKGAVSEFFAETNEGYEPEWLEAVQAVRNNEVQFEGIPRAPANSPRCIKVGMKQVVSAEDNRASFEPQLAA